jgi:adenosylcobinamide-GDP ribazoletransferase
VRHMWMVIIGWLQACIAAFQFLTRLPIPVTLPYQVNLYRNSVIFYPWVGLVIGIVTAGAGVLLDPFLPTLISGTLLVILWTFLSGGLHLDGLMDTSDGIMSHRSRERMLEIMKDSRVGAMGVIVCVFYLILKIALIISLLDMRSEDGWIMLMLIPVWSRTFMVTAIAGWPYARQEQGLGSLFRSVGKKQATIAMVSAIVLSAVSLLIFGEGAWVQSGLVILSILIVTYGIGVVVATYVSRLLGGLTGDVYGALNEMIELGLLLTLVGYVYNWG